jgi:hypothetical protein
MGGWGVKACVRQWHRAGRAVVRMQSKQRQLASAAHLPGVSMMLMRCSPHDAYVAADWMVMPFSLQQTGRQVREAKGVGASEAQATRRG